MDSIMTDSDLPCLVAIAINKNGEKKRIYLWKCNMGRECPIKSNNIFRIASMTKLVTSIAALQLVELDSIELDEDLSSLMPEMAAIPILTNEKTLIKGKNPITLRHLFIHTSGFGYFFTDSLLAKFDTANWKNEDLPRRFESGAQFLYGSSTDWVGKLIEEISGLTFRRLFSNSYNGAIKNESYMV